MQLRPETEMWRAFMVAAGVAILCEGWHWDYNNRRNNNGLVLHPTVVLSNMTLLGNQRK